MSDTETILRKARDHIAQPGMWWQGEFSPRAEEGALAGEPCCADGALLWARQTRLIDDVEPALNLLRKAASAPDIAKWNDAPGRTQAEVVALFDRAIDLAEREATA